MIKQYPFKLGKAITIHKSQGQTFDKVIITPDIFATGQLYVALSRVRTPEGLTLTKEIEDGTVLTDPIVTAFYNNNYTFDVKKKAKKTVKKTDGKSSNKSKKKTSKKTAKTNKTTGRKKNTKTSTVKAKIKKKK